MTNKQFIDRFAYILLEFLSELHDCHVCKYPVQQINGKGKKRTLCSKYNLPVKRVRQNCVDRFPGFTKGDFNGLYKLYLKGKMMFELNGNNFGNKMDLKEPF